MHPTKSISEVYCAIEELIKGKLKFLNHMKVDFGLYIKGEKKTYGDQYFYIKIAKEVRFLLIKKMIAREGEWKLFIM